MVNTRIMKHTLRNILSVQSVSNSKDTSLTESAVTPLDVPCDLYAVFLPSEDDIQVPF